jgi:hypothetical protein
MHLCRYKDSMIKGFLGNIMLCTLEYSLFFYFWTFNSVELLKYCIMAVTRTRLCLKRARGVIESCLSFKREELI